jgi:hypothetical protein
MSMLLFSLFHLSRRIVQCVLVIVKRLALNTVPPWRFQPGSEKIKNQRGIALTAFPLTRYT